MMFPRAPVPSDEEKGIFREMDPVFLQFLATIKASAIVSEVPVMFLYGDDPDQDIDHCVVVVALPSGGVGYSVHPEGNQAEQMRYVKSLVGSTYFTRIESTIMRGVETIELDETNIDKMIDQLKDRLKAHFKGGCGCDEEKKENPQTELPLWVSQMMGQEETHNA